MQQSSASPRTAGHPHPGPEKQTSPHKKHRDEHEQPSTSSVTNSTFHRQLLDQRRSSSPSDSESHHYHPSFPGSRRNRYHSRTRCVLCVLDERHMVFLPSFMGSKILYLKWINFRVTNNSRGFEFAWLIFAVLPKNYEISLNFLVK